MKLDIGTRTIVVLVLVIVLSGCSGFINERTEATGDGTSNETTVTETAGDRTTTKPIHSLPLSNDEIVTAHETALRQAGNYTFKERIRMSNSETDDRQIIYTTARGSVETGELRTYQNVSSQNTLNRQQTYITQSGAGYHRVSSGDSGAISYSRPPTELGVSGHLQPNLTEYFEIAAFEYEGVESDANASVHHYTASNLSAFDGDETGQILGYDRESVTDASIDLFITDDGILKRFELSIKAVDEGAPVEIEFEVTYSHLGETTVEQPAWLSEAKEHVSATEPNPAETVTETVENQTLGAAITATGPRYAVESVEIERQSGGIWDTGGEGYQKAQASSLVSIRSWGEATVEQITLSYDESLFPGEGNGLAMYRFDRELQTFVQVETTVDTNANVARADIDREGTYLVMHTETWNSLFE
ncbi:hypothetical protein ACFFQF_15675 [Haladaptatus pallidirubidus]|uniref:Uncharacterized protein n=1 Tax=Haladaptatus pallidirubidus TaxID=1008152 RepID=A0AAV3UCJ4_9EURY|nr:hypothetical protein [Haladaptatus pallidirubidus]